MEDKMEPIAYKGAFISGQFQKKEQADEEWTVYSPGDLTDEIGQVETSFSQIDEACVVAKKAFHTWKNKSFQERANLLTRLKEVYQARAADLAQVIARETGKPLWEAKTEAKVMASKIDITLNDSIHLVADQHVENALPGVDGYTRFKPRGVMAVVGPFNFPGHLPNGHIIPALATGNTVVFKPSDKTPMTGQLMAELFAEAGFPEGVFNLVQGRGEAGKRLVANEAVDGVLFTGSYDVGLKIKQETMTHYWKILALEMGGKNAAVVWDDADLEKAVYEAIVGSFVTTGQRCSCTSRLLLHKNIYDKFVDQFYATAKKLEIGHWSENPFMGPLISSDSMETYIRFQEISRREGAESLMRGKSLEIDRSGYYVTPSITLVPEFKPESVYQKSEIFGPNVAVYQVEDFEEALAINNSSGYGLAMSLFSQNEQLYQKALMEANVGLLNWNRATNGASSRLPFGGMGKSGNDRPTGHYAVYYCTVPVASLEDPNPYDEQKMLPGINYEFEK